MYPCMYDKVLPRYTTEHVHEWRVFDIYTVQNDVMMLLDISKNYFSIRHVSQGVIDWAMIDWAMIDIHL